MEHNREGNKEGWISQSPPIDWSKGGMTLNRSMIQNCLPLGKLQ